MATQEGGPRQPDTVGLVQDYLRGQNLEQLGRIDEAMALYERGVSAAFDSAGPYDRLIAIYSSRASHAEVIRIAQAALDNVQTYEQKRGWYQEAVTRARRALADVPQAAPKR